MKHRFRAIRCPPFTRMSAVFDECSPKWTDYYRFRTHLSGARSLLRGDEPRQAVDLMMAGLELSRGRPLDDLDTSRADDWRRRVIADEWIPANTIRDERMSLLSPRTMKPSTWRA